MMTSAKDPFADLKDGLPRRKPGEAPALLARKVSKIFGTTKVLDDVSLAVMPGEVHGLLGANGSGKSTFIKTLAGLHDPEPGAELIMYGEAAPLPMPAGGARRRGISFVHQNLALMPSLTVLENMLLNDLAVTQQWNIRWGKARRQVAEIFERFDIHIDPMTLVSDLPQADRALIAICRAFEEVRVTAGEGRGLLILDEPTPFLPKSGVDQLFTLVRAVVAGGASVIFVAHDIDEIREITDRATILRDGRLAGTVVSAEADHERFIELIVGERVTMFQTARGQAPDRPVTASVRKLSADVARDVTFDIREGEVLGLTGLIGSGFDRVPEAIFGALPGSEGSVEIGGKSLAVEAITPARAMAQSIAYLPADRLGKAGVGSLSIAENMALPVMGEFRSLLGMNWPKINAHVSDLGRKYDIRPNRPAQALSSLSGGNAQKVLMAKWLQTAPRLLMLDEPTQGVDVGARQKLFHAIDEASRKGTAVLVASTDAEQLAQICHRVLVFSKGRIVSELTGAAITKDSISEETLRAHAPATDQTQEVA
ncbi:sugar ABC transporter ATP-binding protein [Poseidonocella sedimentorum]|uniref:Monosaccharide ABC transporter ATP-binding protein, CUT2 family n=1 Tax=Poseidonocella sedimentorum TaxID=871652 RepID=A0A1I6E449_9RHOB|nr:sugar ABC transporter ATP-binding protein [Poseidonocella sedimentorum]SFR12248.1 monosaccharide ABC transporter ATP-binding protein, CUT2 family [Poseidonocella sedimentorum]